MECYGHASLFMKMLALQIARRLGQGYKKSQLVVTRGLLSGAGIMPASLASIGVTLGCEILQLCVVACSRQKNCWLAVCSNHGMRHQRKNTQTVKLQKQQIGTHHLTHAKIERGRPLQGAFTSQNCIGEGLV